MALAFLEKIFSLFSSAGDPEAEKKKLLKQIGKDLSKHKYKFYKVRGEEAQPALGKFFYDVYKILAPAQVFMQNAASSSVLRSIVIDQFLDKEGHELQERLTEESIAERVKTTALKELTQEVRDDLVKLFSLFDANLIREIDSAWNAIITFTRLVNFDYFFLLKKFDSNITERSFTYQPKFDSIRSEYVSDDLKDFLEIVGGMDLDRDWRPIFEVLKTFKGVEVVAIEQWNKLVALLKNLLRSDIFSLMVQHIDKNPHWTSSPNRSDEHIVEAHLQKLKTQTEVTIQKSLQERRNNKIEDLAKQIFGTAAVSRMKNYTEKANIGFSKRMLGGYIHVQGLNYLKAFLLDFFKKDIREIVDLFLIRGQWTTNQMSQQLSEAFHDVLRVSDALIAFDEKLADDGPLGSRLRTILHKSERDKEQVVLLRNHLKAINEEAQGMINTAARNLIVVGKNLKSLLDDHARLPHELLINWKEIEVMSDPPIAQRVLAVYKSIYLFIQLMQFFAKGSDQG